MKARKSLFSGMAERWPSSIVSRREIPKFTGGAISAKYIQNMDSLGIGPGGRFRVGKMVVYPLDQLLDWLDKRSSTIKENSTGRKFPGKEGVNNG